MVVVYCFFVCFSIIVLFVPSEYSWVDFQTVNECQLVGNSPPVVSYIVRMYIHVYI